MSESIGWRAIALSSEVGEAPLGVKMVDADIVLFRDAQGRCRALSDRCAHRRAPLSIGQVTAQGLIECPYHGWRYDGATGACREIPNLSVDERVPKTYRVPVFPTVEDGGFVFVSPVADGTAPPPPPLTPALPASAPDMRFGRTRIALPTALYVDALLDAPSSVLGWDGIAIIDDHRFGDPTVSDGHVRASFAACPDTMLRKGGVLADYPYMIVIEAPLCDGPVRLTLTDPLGVTHSAIQLAASSRDRRLTDILWSARGPFAVSFRVAAAADADKLARAGEYVSSFRRTARNASAVSANLVQEG